MIYIYPFGLKVFFVVKDDIIIYSTHPNFEVGDKRPKTYSSLKGDDYIKNSSKDDEIIKKWIVNYFKENGMYEYLI
jgi:hypothetical protein